MADGEHELIEASVHKLTDTFTAEGVPAPLAATTMGRIVCHTITNWLVPIAQDDTLSDIASTFIS